MYYEVKGNEGKKYVFNNQFELENAMEAEFGELKLSIERMLESNKEMDLIAPNDPEIRKAKVENIVLIEEKKKQMKDILGKIGQILPNHPILKENIDEMFPTEEKIERIEL